MLLRKTRDFRVSNRGLGRGVRRLRLESLETRALLAAFIVNTTADTADVLPGDGQAADVDGNTSLRSAVMEANALGGANTIELQAESYSLLLGVTGAPGTLPITSDITLIGAGAGATTIKTADLFRLFDVAAGASLTIEGITLTGGRAPVGGPGGAFGGAIATAGQLTVKDSVLRDNVAGNGGGGVWVAGVSGSAVIERTTFENNRAQWGGAVATRSGSIAISDSLFYGNTATDRGGAVQNEFGSVTMVNTTVSGNAASASGGGIHNRGALTATHSTIVGNRADSNSNGTGAGGGIDSNPLSVQLRGTLVAGNFRGTGNQADDIEGTLVATSSFNLIGDAGTSGGLADGVNGNIVSDGGVGTLPTGSILDTQLSDNGGPTPTHALSRGSRAIDAALTSADLQQDQRGLPRPVGSASDIGAYEVQATDPGFNSSPEAVDDFYSLLAGESLTIEAVDGVLANDTDPEGDLLTALLVDAPQSGTLQLATDGSFTYTPDEGFVGADSFSYRASDGLLESGIATVTLEVKAAEQPGVEIQIGDGSGTIDLADAWITVVIFGSNQLDVSLIALDSLRFGATGTENSIELNGRGSKAQVVYTLADVNGDGHMDLVVRFETKRTGLSVGDSEVSLTGELQGESFSVTQSVTVLSTGGGKGGGGNGGGGGNNGGGAKGPKTR